MWTKNTIKKLLDERLKDYQIVVASEAEPYIHSYTPKGIKVSRTAGGVITALEPIVDVSHGLWVAHSRGNADFENSDEKGNLFCPPGKKNYRLKRLWISKKDLQGWYYGFANEMLWPLCHNVFVRPTFSETAWRAYEKVNRQYADAILEEVKDKKALIWIQDYHLALLPKMLHDARPDLVIGLFWHIPWPISSVFQICPWKKEIVEGLLGAQLLGFHVPSYVLNFLHTVGKTLEAKIDYENHKVTYKDKVTAVQPFPISIDSQAVAKMSQNTRDSKSLVKKYITSTYKYLAVGVERMDYIKGLPERIRAIDRFLEKYPEYQKQFTYLGVAIPTRKLIKRYEDLINEIEIAAYNVNFKYGTSKWQPINFINAPLSIKEIVGIYKSADMALVTSLADGMNLVAKEYVAAGPTDGALILSEQAGAAKELPDAILVNPFDVEQIAEKIKLALEMPAKEKRERMNKMRQVIAKQNVYRWAGKYLHALMDNKK